MGILSKSSIFPLLLLSILPSYFCIHLSQLSLLRIARSTDPNFLLRVRRQALTDPQPFIGPPGVIEVPIPTNIGHFPGASKQIDTCDRSKTLTDDGSCQELLTDGNCRLQEVVLLDLDTNKGFCAPRLCPLDRVFVPRTQLCHDPQDTTVCPPGRELYYSAYGTAVCTCPDGTVEGDDDLDDDVCEFVLGESLQCLPGQVFWFKDFNSPPECLPDPCNGANLNRNTSELPFVPSRYSGECFQIGQMEPVCLNGTIYSLSLEDLKGECVTLEDAGFNIFNPEELEMLKSIYGSTITQNNAAPLPTEPGNSTRSTQQNVIGKTINGSLGNSVFVKESNILAEGGIQIDQNNLQNTVGSLGSQAGSSIVVPAVLVSHSQINQDQNNLIDPNPGFVSLGGQSNQAVKESISNQGSQTQLLGQSNVGQQGQKIQSHGQTINPVHHKVIVGPGTTINAAHQVLQSSSSSSTTIGEVNTNQLLSNVVSQNGGFDEGNQIALNTNTQGTNPINIQHSLNNNFHQNNLQPSGQTIQVQNDQSSQGQFGHSSLSHGIQSSQNINTPITHIVEGIQIPINLLHEANAQNINGHHEIQSNIGQLPTILNGQQTHVSTFEQNKPPVPSGHENIQILPQPFDQHIHINHLGQVIPGTNIGQETDGLTHSQNFADIHISTTNQNRPQGTQILVNNINQNANPTQGQISSTTSGQPFSQNHQQANSIEISEQGSLNSSPEILLGHGTFSNTQNSFELNGRSLSSFGYRFGRSLGFRHPPLFGVLTTHVTILPSGDIIAHLVPNPRHIRNAAEKITSASKVGQAKYIIFEDTNHNEIVHSRRKRNVLSYASPSNVFETRLLGCRPGAVRDINAKCRNTVLPAKIPKRRGTRAAPPVPPTPSCPSGMAFNIRRMCVASSTAQNDLIANNLG